MHCVCGNFKKKQASNNLGMNEVCRNCGRLPPKPKEEINMTKKFDPTKPVKTRGGYPARILCTDLKHPIFPVVAAITVNGTECIDSFTKEGYYRHESFCGFDLINIPEKYTKWINFYPGWAMAHSSRERADQDARRFERIACVKVEFEEGEGL